MEEGPIDTEEPEPGESAEEPIEKPARSGRRKLIAIVAIAVAVVVIGAATYFLAFGNAPPTASFTGTVQGLHLSTNAAASSDPDGDPLTFAWNWGDSSPSGSGVRPAHDYTAPGTYTVVLTVTDSSNLRAAASHDYIMVVTAYAYFLARTAQMKTTVDATGSAGYAGASISGYSWNFGDGTTGSGARTVHNYTSAGRYTITLTVTDSAGHTGNATRFVSPASTTVDILYDRFFSSDCPYDAFWVMRHKTYGDVILNNTDPCRDYYPWVLWNVGLYSQQTPSWVYTLYHMDALVTNHSAYTVNDPVWLPVFNPSARPAADSYIDFNLSFNYLNDTGLNYWHSTPYNVNTGLGDGYAFLLRGNITMDLQESRRIFGVGGATPAQAQSWWYNNTKPFSAPGPLETRYQTWLSNEGNGKYDIYNGFQYEYYADVTDLNATVDPATGATRVQVFVDGYGYDVLMARWWYWGNASYVSAVCLKGVNTTYANCTATLPYGAVKPLGWSPQETCWCENATLIGTVTSGLTMDYQAVSEYQFSAWATAGTDGYYGTPDDEAAWAWGPSLMDYVPPASSSSPAAGKTPNSELRWYEGMTSTFLSPGSFSYGQPYEYMVTPARWNLSAGNSLTIVLPQGPIPWYSPFKSHWDTTTKLGDYVLFDSALTLRSVTPGTGYYLWDDVAKVLSIAGPYDWGTTSLPTDSAPFVSFAPVTPG